jgi:lysophospholipase L1-like esterase
LKGYYSDTNGIFKIDSFTRLEIKRNISSGNKNLGEWQINEVYSLASENIEIINGEVNNEFSSLYKRIIKKDTLTLSDFEKGIIEYVNCPINQDGFKSIPFKQYKSEKPKVLLLGDSFTWGHSTSHKSYSFADQLLAKEYVIYNASITATDVAQYLAIAKKYISLLKPDFVIVNFYLGNDITYYKREPLQNAPVFFYTNAGVLMACPHGKYFENADSAYNFYLNQWSIPENDNIINKIMSKTVLTTLCWRLLLKLEITNYGKSYIAAYYQDAEIRKYSFPYCNVELEEINRISNENDAKFILSSIPEVYTNTFNTKKNFPDLFEGLDFIEMDVTKEDYKLDDGHFNNLGHKRYADFLIKQIEANK